jgi:2-keto-3-deoxy-L-rhamnonate aldolase RhmA
MIKIMYITNNPQVALIGEECGVDRLWVDMEWMGKEERQPGDTVKSHHTFGDITNLRNVLTKSALMVRVNPIHGGSKDEIREAIDRGAEIVMLPMWKRIDEVKRFVDYVGGRATVNLLLETKEAWSILNTVVNVAGIDEIYIGLNDLHISLRKTFMFELLADGTVDEICGVLKANRIKYGFGGIGRIGNGLLPADHILAEHIRLGSQMVILSRSCCNTSIIHDIDVIREDFKKGVQDLRNAEGKYALFTQDQLWNIHLQVKEEVASIVNR